MNIWKSTKVYKSFPFYQPRILEREHSRQSKIFGINHFKLLCKGNNGRFA